MKVVSKSETKHPVSISDPSAASLANPTDFSNLITQLSPQSTNTSEDEAVKTSDIPQEFEQKADDAVSDSETRISSGADVNPLFSQLNLINALNNQNDGEHASSQIVSDSASLMKSYNLQELPPVSEQDEQKSLNSDLLALDKTINKQETGDIKQDEMQWLSQEDKSLTNNSASIQKQLQSQATQAQRTQSHDVAQEAPQPSPSQQPINEASELVEEQSTKVELTTPKKIAHPGVKEAAGNKQGKMQPNSIDKKSASNLDTKLTKEVHIQDKNEVTDKIVANSSSQQNKYTDILTQVGVVLQNQTAKLAENNRVEQASTTSSEHFNLTDLTHEPTIELLPSTLDALNSESYDAKIRIYPPELGHVLATLRVAKNSAELMMWTQNDSAKELVESNLVQLRDKFSQADINLTFIQVQTMNTTSQDHTKNQNSFNQYQNESFANKSQSDELSKTSGNLAPKTSVAAPNTIIDTYA